MIVGSQSLPLSCLAHSGNFMNGTVCVLVTAVSPGPSIRPGIQQVLY